MPCGTACRPILGPNMKDHSSLFQSTRFADVSVVIRHTPQTRLRVEGADISETEDSSGLGRTSGGFPKRDGQTADGKAVVPWPNDDDDLSVELQRFPGHHAILCQSDVFDAQAQFFSYSRCTGESPPTLNLTINDASHLPAVEAVISTLYGIAEAVPQLQQHQLAPAARYADMLQLEATSAQAMKCLSDAVKTAEGLSDESLRSLCGMAWPNCMLPLLPVIAADDAVNKYSSENRTNLLQQVIVSVLGSLEDVWSDPALSSSLLGLPLGAMRLLLSSDQLLVHSEDTVLYTAVRYVAQLSADPGAQECALQCLSQLIRAPHMSQFQLTAQALNNYTSVWNILQQHQALLRHLLSLRSRHNFSAKVMKAKVAAAPAAWQLPTRQILQQRANEVHLVWRVAVADIKACCEKHYAVRRSETISSPDVTPPLNGVDFRLYITVELDSRALRTRIRVYSQPSYCAVDVLYTQQVSITTPVTRVTDSIVTPLMSGKHWGVVDAVDLYDCSPAVTVIGGWNEAAWVAKGLPVDGDIELKLTVFDVF